MILASAVLAMLAPLQTQADWYSCPSEGVPITCKSSKTHSCVSEAQANAIASALARLEGIDLSVFSRPRADYGCESERCLWFVNFVGKDRLALGEHFSVQVDASSCATVLHPGL